MTRVYARDFGGARIHESAPQGNWKILTILGALSTRGMIAAMTIEEATDKDIFPALSSPHCCHSSPRRTPQPGFTMRLGR
jgi:hypothetical protein